MHRNATITPVVRMVVRGEPVPWAVVPETDPDSAWPIIARHEPPHVRVVVPARMDEDVVHALDHAVSVDPGILSVRVAPIAVDPDPPRTEHFRVIDGHDPRRRRRLFGCSNRVRLLHDDHGVALDFLGRAILNLDDDVLRRFARASGFWRGIASRIAIVGNLEVVAVVERWIAGRALMIGGRGERTEDGRHPCGKPHRSSELRHGSSFICTPAPGYRHPPDAERARPARQNAQKVLGLRPFE
jgi:hypothetical protein